MSEKPTVALLFGGRGYENRVSVAGAEYILPLIDRQLFTPLPVYLSEGGEWLIPKEPDSSLRDRAEGKAEAVNALPATLGGVSGLLIAEREKSFYKGRLLPLAAAFPLLHGDHGEDGEVQGALECAGIPYVGADVTAGALTTDKGYTKLIAKSLGIATAEWVTHGPRDRPTDTVRRAYGAFGYPMFIKPSRLGSSVGASPAWTEKEALAALEAAARLGRGEAIIERLIDVDRELECAYYSAGCKELFTNPGEIRCDGVFYDYESKYGSNGAAVSDRAEVSPNIKETVRELSARLIKALGLRDLARVDFLLAKGGNLYFNEINTLPGFTSGSLYRRLLESEGIGMTEAVNALIRQAIARG